MFPSVTGPAYTPFLLGRFPGPVGIPALRWYDRSRTRCTWPDYARSYVGVQVRKFDGDLDAEAPTIFDLVPNSLAAMSVVTRGLAHSRRLGTLTPRTALRVTLTHFRGRVSGWLDVDHDVAEAIVRRQRDERPDYLFAAFVGIDKSSHAEGHESAGVHDAMRIVDDAAGRLRADAEAGGWWKDTHLWIVSDHGHSTVEQHEDLAGVVAATGARTVAHPWSVGIAPDAAVMVSGNAMAHIYVELGSRTRPWWLRSRRSSPGNSPPCGRTISPWPRANDVPSRPTPRIISAHDPRIPIDASCSDRVVWKFCLIAGTRDRAPNRPRSALSN